VACCVSRVTYIDLHTPSRVIQRLIPTHGYVHQRTCTSAPHLFWKVARSEQDGVTVRPSTLHPRGGAQRLLSGYGMHSTALCIRTYNSR
jgi:hypothetical protein